MMKNANLGFTLAEMLTVLVIIMILWAVSLSAFFPARARAKQTVCLSNLHQIYLGIELYSQDFDQLPYSVSDNKDWMRYTGGIALRCPNADSQAGSRLDYEITAGPLLDIDTNTASREWNDMLEACRQIRGDQFPYALDPNHRRKVDAYQGNGQRVLVVRANGAALSVPFRPNPLSWPCDPRLGPDIQH